MPLVKKTTTIKIQRKKYYLLNKKLKTAAKIINKNTNDAKKRSSMKRKRCNLTKANDKRVKTTSKEDFTVLNRNKPKKNLKLNLLRLTKKFLAERNYQGRKS